MQRFSHCFLGAAASAIIGCGGSVTETPANLADSDAGALDADAQDIGVPDFATPAGESGVRPLGVDQCRGDDDCRSPSRLRLCLAPEPRLWYGGPCPPVASPCATDDECRLDGGAWICDVAPGNCPNGPKSCTPGCMAPADCTIGQTCTDHRCIALSCVSEAQCPTDFACVGGLCARKACTTDATCSGYCVREKCYAVPGSCGDPLF